MYQNTRIVQRMSRLINAEQWGKQLLNWASRLLNKSLWNLNWLAWCRSVTLSNQSQAETTLQAANHTSGSAKKLQLQSTKQREWHTTWHLSCTVHNQTQHLKDLQCTIGTVYTVRKTSLLNRSLSTASVGDSLYLLSFKKIFFFLSLRHFWHFS